MLMVHLEGLCRYKICLGWARGNSYNMLRWQTRPRHMTYTPRGSDAAKGKAQILELGGSMRLITEVYATLVENMAGGTERAYNGWVKSAQMP